MKEILITRAVHKKPKPDPSALGFGKYFTDHMFLMDYNPACGWHTPRVVPYGPLSLDPSATVLHYAQEVFEGMKAYRTPSGGVQLFRPVENVRRLNSSCRRLCIPELPEDLALEAILALVRTDADWVPSAEGTSLYLRPFIFATDPSLGVHVADHYTFCIIACPVGAYYADGINPVRIFVESEDVRAVRGGMGEVKTGGNYAASLRAGHRAAQQGFAQVLWLDGVHRRYIEEVGSMNVFFKIDGKVITPALQGSVLPGITRKSCIELLGSWGIAVEERVLDVDELFSAGADGTLEEAWGSGTAAVISPIGEMCRDTRTITVAGGQIGPLTARLYNALTAIQWGTAPDALGWIVPVIK